MKASLALLLLVGLGSCDRLLAFGQGARDRGGEGARIDLPPRPPDGPPDGPAGDHAGERPRPADSPQHEAATVDRAGEAISGSGAWSRVWGVTAAGGNAVTMTSGSIYVVGQYEGALPLPLLPTLPGDGADGFVVRLDRSGTAHVSSRISSSGVSGPADSVRSVIAVAGAGAEELWVGGQLQGTLNLAKPHSGLYLFRLNPTSLVIEGAANISGGFCLQDCGVVALSRSKGGIGMAATFEGMLSIGAVYSTTGAPGSAFARWEAGAWQATYLITLPMIRVLGRAFAGDTGAAYFAGMNVGTPTPGSSSVKRHDGTTISNSQTYVSSTVAGLALDGQQPYMVGVLAGTENIAGKSLTSAGKDILIVGLDANGNNAWAEKIGGAGDEEPLAVAAAGGALYITGRFTGTTDLGKGPLISSGARDGFVFRFDPQSRQTVWSYRFGGDLGLDEGRGIAADGQQVVVAGVVSGAGKVNGPNNTAVPNLVALNGVQYGSAFVLSVPP